MATFGSYIQTLKIKTPIVFGHIPFVVSDKIADKEAASHMMVPGGTPYPPPQSSDVILDTNSPSAPLMAEIGKLQLSVQRHIITEDGSVFFNCYLVLLNNFCLEDRVDFCPPPYEEATNNVYPSLS